MRVSDEDRQRAVDELRRHCAAGRLDVDEYAARVERALSASTLDELDQVRADLPMLRIAEPGGHRIWAGGSLRIPDPEPAGPDGASLQSRVAALVVALVSILVVLGAIVLSLVAEWTWALVLIVGWVAGMVQGRLGRNARRDR